MCDKVILKESVGLEGHCACLWKVHCAHPSCPSSIKSAV